MKTSEKISLAGTLIGTVGGLGASILVGTAATPIIATMKTASKVMAIIGVSGLGGIVGDKVQAWYSNQFANIGNFVESISMKTKEEQAKQVNKEVEA